MRLERRFWRPLSCALWTGLLVACGGGGAGADAASGGPGASANGASLPAAGVYLDTGATATALRPSWVAAVGTSVAPNAPPWVAWEALTDGDTRLTQGRLDVTAAATELQYFDAASVQAAQVDWRQSSADRLRGAVTGLSQPIGIQGERLPAARLLTLAELSGRSWQGHWRHHGPTALTRGEALNRTLSFAAQGGRQVFANQTILNCYVDAELSEHQAGQPGLFSLSLTLAQIPGQASCSHAGSYQGLAVALRAAGGGSDQLRLAATDAATQRAISYAAQ